MPDAGLAADDERRELTGVPDELAFATKPQLAAALLERARQAGMPARWVATDEVYGGHDLRTWHGTMPAVFMEATEILTYNRYSRSVRIRMPRAR